jgi:hypothetical protein
MNTALASKRRPEAAFALCETLENVSCLSVLPTTPADLYVRACRSVRVNSDG